MVSSAGEGLSQEIAFRIVDPAHFAPLLGRKPRAAAMLYRDTLLRLGGVAPAFLAALSSRQRARLPEELRAVYALGQTYGTANLLAAMALAIASISDPVEEVRLTCLDHLQTKKRPEVSLVPLTVK